MGLLAGRSKVLHIALDIANVNWLQHNLIYEIQSGYACLIQILHINFY